GLAAQQHRRRDRSHRVAEGVGWAPPTTEGVAPPTTDDNRSSSPMECPATGVELDGQCRLWAVHIGPSDEAWAPLTANEDRWASLVGGAHPTFSGGRCPPYLSHLSEASLSPFQTTNVLVIVSCRVCFFCVKAAIR